MESVWVVTGRFRYSSMPETILAIFDTKEKAYDFKLSVRDGLRATEEIDEPITYFDDIFITEYQLNHSCVY